MQKFDPRLACCVGDQVVVIYPSQSFCDVVSLLLNAKTSPLEKADAEQRQH
jgi:hypothetical protein